MAGIEHPGVSSDPLTPVVFLERTLRVFPERTAVVHRDQRLSYAEFAEETGRMAGALRRAGVQEGDRVATQAVAVAKTTCSSSALRSSIEMKSRPRTCSSPLPIISAV